MATIDQVQPQRLYRYCSLAKFDRELAALQQNYLFCAAYTTLNDPMEGVFRSSKVFRESDASSERTTWDPKTSRPIHSILTGFASNCVQNLAF